MAIDKEKYKALIYDIQRATTDGDAHDLIIKYAQNLTGKKVFSDNIICVKDVTMVASGDREFTKGKTYRLQIAGNRFDAINDSGIRHGIGMDKDRFFHEYFAFI